VTDASNRDWRFYRNRLRGETLPYLETLNPGVRARFHQTAELLRDEDEALEAAAAAAWQACCIGESPGALALDAERLRALPVALQRRLLRRGAAALRPGLRDIDFAAIQRGVGFLHSPAQSRQADWIAGLRLEVDGGRLWLAETDAALPAGDWPHLPPGSRLELPAPGTIMLPGGWQLRADVMLLTPEGYNDIQNNTDPYQAWLDHTALLDRLLARPRLPGDRFRPLGMGGHSMKLSDFMINAGMPRRARSGWPLVVAGDEIAWVPGYRLAEPFAITPVTHTTVKIELIRPGANPYD
jgi:tRNA(Ile)-lysidine synthase